ncbi:MAG: trigger factor Tig [Moraxellaceae bacterium]|jgi:trigger factor|nr:trigger factor Tig [Moraxellaceae bacterium]
MQVSVETTSGLERRMTITVPAARVDSEVNQRINKTARTVRMDGFRPGKVPVAVVKKRFGASIRQEAMGDLIRDCFYEAVTQEKLNPAGFPTIESVKDEANADIAFVASFEVYPEVKLNSFSAIKVERPQVEVSDADVDKMIDTLRRQRASWAETAEPANDGDRLDIDFEGSVNGEAFDGGTAKGFSLTLGSKRMIPGFEEGLVGAKAGDERTLNVTFPEDYQAENLKGKAAVFKVKVNKVEAPVLPELDDTFIKSFGIKDGGVDKFRVDVRKNMERELRQAVKNKVKGQVLEGLIAAHELDVPKALVSNEVGRLRQNMLRQFGGNAKNISPDMLPDELFAEQAKRSVMLGLLIGEVIKSAELQADAGRVRAFIEEVAESYESPAEVVNWYYGNKEQLQQVEAVVLEDQVVEHILSQAQVSDAPAKYEDVLRPQQ